MFQRFLKSEDGAIALLFAIVLVPMVAVSGAAVDLARAYVTKQQISHAIDAAALAAGAINGTDAEMRAAAQKYFDANYDAQQTGIPVTLTMTFADDMVGISAHAEMDTTLLRVLGIDEIDIGTDTEVVRQRNGVEVVLVLDVTGSMSGSKLQSLKSSANEFIDILLGEGVRPDSTLIGIVPFAATVNIGTANGAFTIQSNPSSYNADPAGWRGCIEARRPVSDRKDTLDTYIGTSDRWPRYRFDRHNSLNNFPPVQGARGEVRGPNKDCVPELLPLTDNRTALENTISGLQARGMTHIALGAVWGWRVVSPEQPFTEGHAYTDTEYKKVVVIMTDGQNTTQNPNSNPSRHYYTAYGKPVEKRLGRNTNAIVAEQNARTLEVCTNMKDKNVIVYTITFQVSSNSTRQLMEDCASSPSNYFDSPSASALRASFSTIAEELTKLRISR